MPRHVCPWWLAYTFDNPLRRLFHNPEQIVKPFLREGMTAVDLGCGMGFFSIGMARIVGDSGTVIAVDLQPQMLEILVKRASKAGVANRIKTVFCDEQNIKVHETADFVLAFWMVHETPDPQIFLDQINNILKPKGKLCIAEPKMHVTKKEFASTVSIAQETGFKRVDTKQIRLSHSAMFTKS